MGNLLMNKYVFHYDYLDGLQDWSLSYTDADNDKSSWVEMPEEFVARWIDLQEQLGVLKEELGVIAHEQREERVALCKVAHDVRTFEAYGKTYSYCDRCGEEW